MPESLHKLIHGHRPHERNKDSHGDGHPVCGVDSALANPFETCEDTGARVAEEAARVQTDV